MDAPDRNLDPSGPLVLEDRAPDSFVAPSKRIKTKGDLLSFKRAGKTYRRLLLWMKLLNSACISKANDAACTISDNVREILNMLTSISAMVDRTPPVEGAMRFGNSAFRTLFDAIQENTSDLHSRFIGDRESALVELGPYLQDSFGNRQRIDYGTGHELHFVIWLYCLNELGIIGPVDYTAIVTRVFPSYLCLCRKIQQTYGLEPAGSRGVWCLDDHQFIPFIWGAAQLRDHPSLSPSSVLDASVVQKNSEKYLYMASVNHIYQVKTGPFFEHSPDLYNISGADNWFKINRGMFMKYQDDVLSKWPVMQHVLFGTLFPLA